MKCERLSISVSTEHRTSLIDGSKDAEFSADRDGGRARLGRTLEQRASSACVVYCQPVATRWRSAARSGTAHCGRSGRDVFKHLPVHVSLCPCVPHLAPAEGRVFLYKNFLETADGTRVNYFRFQLSDIRLSDLCYQNLSSDKFSRTSYAMGLLFVLHPKMQPGVLSE